MKKQLLLLLSISIASYSFAQNKITYGIKAGINSASIKGEAAENLNNLIGFANGNITTHSTTGLFAGGSVNLPLTETFSLEPSLYYSQKGYEMRGKLSYKDSEFLSANGKAQLQAHYIDLPVLLKANLNGFQVFAGPQISYLAKADLKTKAGVMGFNFFNNKRDMTDELNKIDAGVTGGVGYQFTNGLNVSAVYDHGLTRMDENRNFEAYNRSFKVGLGFSF